MVKSKEFILSGLICFAFALCFMFGAMSFNSSMTVYASGTEHDHSTWTVWGDDDVEKTSMPDTAGDYVLGGDITISATWNVPTGTTNLCLNGYVINANGGTFSVITVGENATLNVYDCGTTVHNGYVDSNSLWHLDATNEHSGLEDEKDITGGIITGENADGTGTSGTDGGGVYINRGTFTMNGGTIAGNVAKTYGGGVYVGTGGTFTMTGDSVISNNTGKQGAGVYSKGTFNMSENSKITNNKGISYGGGVFVHGGGEFSMSGGSIDNNKANTGGGVAVSGSGNTFKMTGGSITDNKATNGGGVCVAANNNFSMVGGTISNNTAQTGGGVYAGDIITLGGTAQITENTAKGADNNVYLIAGKTITLATGENAPVFEGDNTMQIGITLQSGTGNFATGVSTDDYLACFTSDNANLTTKASGVGDPITSYTYDIEILVIIEGVPDGAITVDKPSALKDDTVTITLANVSGYNYTADSLKATYNNGEEDVELDLTDGENNTWTFTMPASAVTISAEFIEKQTISITFDTNSQTYNGEEKKLNILSGEGDSAMLVFTTTYYANGDWTTPVTPIKAGSYNVRITRSEDDTYKAYEEELENGLVIEKAEVTAPTIESKTYIGSTLTAEIEESDLYTVSENKGGTNAGDYDVKLTLKDSDNYKWETVDGAVITLKFTISKAPLKITAKDKTIKFNQDPANDGVSYDGFVNDETSAVLSGTLTFEYSYGKGNNAGEYTITPSGLTSDNYKITFVNGKLTVEKAEQVIIINDISKIYDESPIILWDSSYTKLGDGEVTVEFKLASEDDDKYTTTAPTNAGSYVVRVSVAEGTNYLEGSQTRNFEISYYYINQVGFGNIKQPIATQTAPTKTGGMLVNTKYLEALTWSPTLVDGKFGYNTIYTATVVLEIKDKTNHRFAEEITLKGAGNGWTKSTDSTGTKLIYTKAFEKTGKIPQVVEITNDISKTYNGEIVSTPTYTKLGDGTVTVEYKLATEDDDKYTTTAPTNTGSYVVRVRVAETETHLSGYDTAEFTISKATYDMSGITFTDKTVKTTDNDADKKLAVSGTLPIGLDGIGLTVSYVDNDNTARGVYTVTAKFSTTSINYNVPSDMTATLTILWVRDSEKESGSDNEFVIVTSETGIDPTLTLKVDVVKIDNNDSQYKEVTDSIKKESSFNSYLDRVFGVYDVSLIDQNDVKVQPDGTIKVYMTVPEEIKNCEFRIYHVHNGVASKAEYVLDDGYAVIETDELSEFVFVYEQTSLLPWIIILSVISALGIAGIVLLLLKNKKDKQGRE